MNPTEPAVCLSRHTGVAMRHRRHGQAGRVLLYLPSSAGDHREFEDYGLSRICEPWLRSGRLQVFATDGFGPDSLFHDGLPPPERMLRYAAFERHVVDELLPLIHERTGAERVDPVGTSYGAFVAANLLFKQPRRVGRACGLGGVYGLWHRLDGHHDDDVYFHTPLEYLPRLEDPLLLGAIRATEGLTLYGAAADSWLESTERMAQVLRDKQLPHTLHVWDAPANHHEYWWRRQLEDFLQRNYGAA